MIVPTGAASSATGKDPGRGGIHENIPVSKYPSFSMFLQWYAIKRISKTGDPHGEGESRYDFTLGCFCQCIKYTQGSNFTLSYPQDVRKNLLG